MLAVTEIVRQFKQGQTTPFLCRTENDEQYIVKGARATAKGLVKEWIAAHLCRSFGLPNPDYDLIYVDDALVEYGYDDLGPGMCFGSRFIPNIQDVTFAELEFLSNELLRDLYIFDYWIKNDDRNLTSLGGNPNLFYEPLKKEVYVLDHNLSFEPNFSLEKHKELHLGRSAWNDPQLPLWSRVEYEDKMEASLKNIDAAISSLPEEWLEYYDLDSIESEIIVVLKQFKLAKFWEDIR